MITPDVLKEVTHRLVKAYNPLSIYLFGSYAWGAPSFDILDLAEAKLSVKSAAHILRFVVKQLTQPAVKQLKIER